MVSIHECYESDASDVDLKAASTKRHRNHRTHMRTDIHHQRHKKQNSLEIISIRFELFESLLVTTGTVMTKSISAPAHEESLKIKPLISAPCPRISSPELAKIQDVGFKKGYSLLQRFHHPKRFESEKRFRGLENRTV